MFFSESLSQFFFFSCLSRWLGRRRVGDVLLTQLQRMLVPKWRDAFTAAAVRHLQRLLSTHVVTVMQRHDGEIGLVCLPKRDEAAASTFAIRVTQHISVDDVSVKREDLTQVVLCSIKVELPHKETRRTSLGLLVAVCRAGHFIRVLLLLQERGERVVVVAEEEAVEDTIREERNKNNSNVEFRCSFAGNNNRKEEVTPFRCRKVETALV